MTAPTEEEAPENESSNDVLKQELLKQLMIAAVMIVSIAIAAYVERQASGPDPLPGQFARWQQEWRRRRAAEQEWHTSWARLAFEVHCLMPGALQP